MTKHQPTDFNLINTANFSIVRFFKKQRRSSHPRPKRLHLESNKKISKNVILNDTARFCRKEMSILKNSKRQVLFGYNWPSV